MNIKNLIPTFSIGLILMFLLSYLYAFVTAFSPIIYLNFGLLLIFGSFIGLISFLEAYFGRVQEKKHWIIISALNSILLWYLSWVVYLLAISGNIGFFSLKGVSDFFELVYRPDIVFQALNDLSNNAIWSIGNSAFDSSTYLLVWLIELVIIIIAPIIFLKKQSTFPYSETTENWYQEFVLSKDFGSIRGVKNGLDRLQSTPTTLIDELGFGNANNYSQISIFYLPQEKVQYISVFHITIDREDNKTKDEIYHLIEIDKQMAKMLIDKWEGKRNKYIFF